MKINQSSNSVQTGAFDLWPTTNKLSELRRFLRTIEPEDIVLFSTYDDASVHLDQSSRRMISVLGSRTINNIAFRDSWVFVGGRLEYGFSWPNELRVESSHAENRFGGWPAAANISGCIPKRQPADFLIKDEE